jgi:hypothetical protein
VNRSSSGSTASALLGRCVLGREPEARRRLAPHLLEVRARGRDALVVQAVEPPRPLGPRADEPRLLQQPEVPRDRRAADRQLVGELLDGAVAAREQLDDRPAVRVAERVEGVSGDGAERDSRNGSRNVTVARMRSYESSATIDASPDVIWRILTDAPAYAAWDSGVERVEGRIAPGETIKVYSQANPGRAFPVTVTDFQPARSMTWSGGMPLGLFKGVRTFTLAPENGGATRFRMREEYTGPLLPLIWRSMPDLGPSFEQFARGLKARAEEGR